MHQPIHRRGRAALVSTPATCSDSQSLASSLLTLPTRRVYAEDSTHCVHPAPRKPLPAKPASALPTSSVRAIAARSRATRSGSNSSVDGSGGGGSTEQHAIVEAPHTAEAAAWDAYDSAFESVLASMWDDVRSDARIETSGGTWKSEGTETSAREGERPGDGECDHEGGGMRRAGDRESDAQGRDEGNARGVEALGKVRLDSGGAGQGGGADSSRTREPPGGSSAACGDLVVPVAVSACCQDGQHDGEGSTSRPTDDNEGSHDGDHEGAREGAHEGAHDGAHDGHYDHDDDGDSSLCDEPLPLSTLPHGCHWPLSHLPPPPTLIELTPPPASPAASASPASSASPVASASPTSPVTTATAASSPFFRALFSESPVPDLPQPLGRRSIDNSEGAFPALMPCSSLPCSPLPYSPMANSPPAWPSNGRLSPASSLLLLDTLIQTPTRLDSRSSSHCSEQQWDGQWHREAWRSNRDSTDLCRSSSSNGESCSGTVGIGGEKVEDLGAMAYRGGNWLGGVDAPLLPASSPYSPSAAGGGGGAGLGWLLPTDTLDYMAQVQNSVQRELHSWLDGLGERTKGLREDMQEQFGRMKEEMAVTFNVLEEEIQEMVDELEDEGLLPDWTKLFDDDGGGEDEEWEELVSGRGSRRGGVEREEEEKRRFLQKVMLAQRVYFDIHGEVVRRVQVRERNASGGGAVKASRNGPVCIPVTTKRMESAAVVF
ncbi:unnamed protein product [Closterium sp. Naga37s-1]|nr:unnamed protein product [Closterium sp. Naga37s-1]